MNILKILLSSIVITLASISFNPLFSKNLSKTQIRQKVDSLFNLGWDYLATNPDSSLYLGNIQKELASQIQYELGIVNACYVLGYARYNKLQFDLAALNFFNGLNFTKGKSDIKFKRKKIFLLQSLGSVYYNTYQYDNSLDYYFKALEIARNLNDQRILGELYYNIAINKRKQEKYDLCNEYSAKSLEAARQANDRYRIAMVYNLLGGLHKEEKKYNQSKLNYQKAIQVGKEIKGLEKDVIMFRVNLGENYFKQNQYDTAKAIYLEALTSSTQLGDVQKLKWIYNNLGDVYLEENDFEKSISYYKKSLELKNPEVIDEKAQYAYDKISNAYEALGQYKLAFQYKSSYQKETDKVLALKEDLSEQNAQYRMKEVEWMLERQQQQTRLLAMQTKNFWFKISISLLIIILAYAAYQAMRYYRGVRKVKKWLAEG